MRTAHLFLIASTLHGCALLGRGNPNCSEDPLPPGFTKATVLVDNTPGSAWVSADFVVSGRVVDANFALSALTIGTTPATASGTNYGTWTATIPVAPLRDQPQPVVLDVWLETVCGGPRVVDTIEVWVEPASGRPVTDLSATLTIPDVCYLPTNGSAVADLDICASDRSTGAAVGVTSSPNATLVGPIEGKITLQPALSDACGADSSSAAVLVAPTGEGTVRVNAVGPGTAASTTSTRAAGAPRFTPASVTFPSPQAGLSRSLVLETGGLLEACTLASANPAAFDVSFDGTVVSTTSWAPASSPQPWDGTSTVDSTTCNGFVPSNAVDIDVVTTGSVVPGDVLWLRCWDVFGQASTATLSVPVP